MTQSHLRLAPGEESAEHAIERALNELTPDQTYHSEPEPKPSTNRDLVKRSKDSLATNVQHLQNRIDSVNTSIREAGRKRDEVITKAHEVHRAFLLDAEAELRQIAAVKAAIDSAVMTLARDPEA
jgi:uncharacterized coiled-coil DUF342 family protein